MITNLSTYFLPEQNIFLHEINYSRIEEVQQYVREERLLNCSDHIEVRISGDEMVRIIVTRELFFDPQELFRLSVSFGADLKIDPQKNGEYKWDEINLAEEFKENGDFVTGNLMARITLMIAEITSAYGQQPIILQPEIAGRSDIQ